MKATISFATMMLLTITFFGCAAPLQRDAIEVDPGHYSVDFENDKVRVIRIKYGPNEKSVMHQHREGVAVFLSDNRVRFTFPDGKTEEATARLGETQWGPAIEHLPENLEDKPLEVILVELKPRF